MEPYTVCSPAQCAGCMACVDVCPKSAIRISDSVEHMDALIDGSLCIRCGQCHQVCQVNHPADFRRTIESWQGWASPDIREGSSSGGFASAIMRAFVAGGGTVASCRLEDGDFRFALARTQEELEGFAGSKYAKSNPSGIYRSVVRELEDGSTVLFIGLPCQVSAIRNFVGRRKSGALLERFYTIDLICHGTPSIKILQQTLRDYSYDLNDVGRIWFRRNTEFGLCTDFRRLVPGGCTDAYTMAFLGGICYTRNCHSCRYATGERVGDLTLGDSWGTNFTDEESDGISLALVQTQKGRELLDMAGLKLREVDYANAVANNRQLRHPTEVTPERGKFFSFYERTGSVRKAVLAVWPKRAMKQRVKEVLVRIGLISEGGVAHLCDWPRFG